jgi:hypothetical protein
MNEPNKIEPELYYAALGKIAVAMNLLELHIRHAFQKVLGQETGTFLMALSATDNFSRLLEVLRMSFAYKVSDPNVRTQFDSLVAQIGRLNEDRSRYIHSNWFFTLDRSRVIRWRSRRWPIRGEQDSQPKLEDLKKLVDDIGETTNDFLKFIDAQFPSRGATPTST